MTTRPPLALLVRWHVLGLSDIDDELLPSTIDDNAGLVQVGQAPTSQTNILIDTVVEAVAESFVSTEILTRCNSVSRLQLAGALHRPSRQWVMLVLHSRTYEILICAPHLYGAQARWGDGFYRAEDVLALAAHTLAILEIECMLPGRSQPSPAWRAGFGSVAFVAAGPSPLAFRMQRSARLSPQPARTRAQARMP